MTASVLLQPHEDFLRAAAIPLRLTCLRRDGWPLVLSLWFLYDEGALYCATGSGAHVVRYLRDDPRCGFEIASDHPPYCGVRGRALAEIRPAEGDVILRRLLQRYIHDLDHPLARSLLARVDDEVALRLEPQSLHVWNFSTRMTAVPGMDRGKVCPTAMTVGG